MLGKKQPLVLVGILGLVNGKFVLAIPVCQHSYLFSFSKKDMWGRQGMTGYYMPRSGVCVCVEVGNYGLPREVGLGMC